MLQLVGQCLCDRVAPAIQADVLGLLARQVDLAPRPEWRANHKDAKAAPSVKIDRRSRHDHHVQIVPQLDQLRQLAA